jgi:hypothetical protein
MSLNSVETMKINNSPSLVFLVVPLLLAAQAYRESNGIIDMDGE